MERPDNGIVLHWRKGPWLVDPEPGTDQLYQVYHWGTLLDGAKLAWEADVKKEIRSVQMSVQTPIPNCKRYDYLFDLKRDFLFYP
jgi:hypothetical protein